MSKFELKETALGLRRRGLSYSEILTSVPVAKSTLSLWLREVGLSKRQKQKLSDKKLQAALRGAQRRREQRLATTEKIQNLALQDIGEISRRELWLFGVALYWAEGSKEKEGNYGSGIQFTNSDPFMVKLFLKWLTESIGTKIDDIKFEIYIHENSKNNIEAVKEYWSKVTECPITFFTRTYFKKNKIKTDRRNTGNQYFGLLRIGVKASSGLNRRIAGWVRGICRYYWGVV